MKKLVLFLMVSVLFASNVFAGQTIETIMNRKSVRSYEEGKIEQQDLDIILKAAMAAPSARNIQPWAFVVVDNREDMDALAEKLPYAKMLKEASIAIIVCGKKDSDDFWMMDCSAASQNILLAVEDLGLGAVWTAVYPDKKRVEAVRKALAIPQDYIPLNVIPIGKPKGETKPKDKYDAGKIHLNRW
ncbi:MAG: nitroreductase family protein [Endomicrobium sp.]|jgi:nitroreductase|nr:nitroreductase family protein [Endomicrobium sp.]